MNARILNRGSDTRYRFVKYISRKNIHERGSYFVYNRTTLIPLKKEGFGNKENREEAAAEEYIQSREMEEGEREGERAGTAKQVKLILLSN